MWIVAMMYRSTTDAPTRAAGTDFDKLFRLASTRSSHRRYSIGSPHERSACWLPQP